MPRRAGQPGVVVLIIAGEGIKGQAAVLGERSGGDAVTAEGFDGLADVGSVGDPQRLVGAGRGDLDLGHGDGGGWSPGGQAGQGGVDNGKTSMLLMTSSTPSIPACLCSS